MDRGSEDEKPFKPGKADYFYGIIFSPEFLRRDKGGRVIVRKQAVVCGMARGRTVAHSLERKVRSVPLWAGRQSTNFDFKS
jgi:hypothetical protein